MLLLLQGVAAFVPHTLYAKPAPPTISITVDPDTVLTGDHAQYTVTVRHSADQVATLMFPPKRNDQPLDAAELVSQQRFSTIVAQGNNEERFVLEFALFGTGQRSFPPFYVTMRHRTNKNVLGNYSLALPTVYVRALTDSTMRELRPIKSPQPPPFPALFTIVVVLAIFALAAIGWLGFFIMHHILGKQAVDVNSTQVAQRQLRKLNGRLSADMSPRECYEELSNIMRTFLEHHYRIPALEAVTQEIERDLKKLGVVGYDAILALLRQADLVKFADTRPDVEESRQSIHKASEIIRTSAAVHVQEEVPENNV